MDSLEINAMVVPIIGQRRVRFAGAVRGELESLLNMWSWFVDYMRVREI